MFVCYTIHQRQDLQEILKIDSKSTFNEYLNKLRKVDFEAVRFGAFSKFLRKYRMTFYFESRNISRYHIQWEKQYKFLYDEDDNLLVDFVGKFESLQKDFDLMCEKVGIPVRTLPHNTHGVRRPKNKHFTEYYDQEAKEIVEDIYAKDISTFGYQFN